MGDYWEDNAPTIVKIAKQRGGGEGRVNMIFNKVFSRFKGSDNKVLDDMIAHFEQDSKTAKHAEQLKAQEDEEVPF